ncbi:hypothetical protein C1I95_20765 [Micromonospora craterilacus]|uniref:Uncharacterized protein n=1 Tax=Micromonospora craterilacus TaxID=1655439 RepID=A0A2W2EZS9_9ACTN|nr:hypothetical protein [Micromonospora craterilacus]PZG14867.1 hypothetical protein C1I95_20765 [Micromonospora craterilacus]
MPINVDDAFLRRASSLNSLIAEEVTASPGGNISDINLRPGHTSFAPGARVQSEVAAAGSAIHQRLTEIRDTATRRSTQLNLYITVSDETEGLNNVTAGAFLSATPAWNVTAS